MTRDAQDVIKQLRTCLASRIGSDRFDLWIGKQVRFQLVDDRLVVCAPDQFSLDRLRKQFRSDISVVARDVVQREVVLDFQVDATPKADTANSSPSLSAATGQQDASSTLQFRTSAPPSRPVRRNVTGLRTIDSFVVGAGNRIAYTAAKSICERPGAVSPLFIYGPPGCGKSHLQEAICSTVRQSLGLRRVLSLSSEQFTSYFLDALQGSGLPSFRRKCRDVDVLAIDNIQFFAGKRATLVELQHTMDALLRQGRQLILTADRPPNELSRLGPELAARVTGGLVCGIESADYETRVAIARQMAVRSQRPIPDDVLQLVAAELTGDARRIAGALNRLEATSEALEKSITIDFARSTLAEIFRATVQVVRLTDIDRAVCEAFGLDARSLKNGGKGKSASHPRMLAMWLARKYTRAAFSEISEHFGRRSHSTVISAEKKVNRWVSDGATIQLGPAACNVEDAIRRIETQLRIG
ncbi:MAG: AAA family ATPase [Planctomycetaceae bacterium]|nr:AAA family ATPase [Planctomycetales bacterium]MCB9926907.1 AAA family ATPase [Planctomycetaceae bacterium]